MMPLIALVTLISGVCSAGVTFHTTCQPTKHREHEHGDVLEQLDVRSEASASAWP